MQLFEALFKDTDMKLDTITCPKSALVWAVTPSLKYDLIFTDHDLKVPGFAGIDLVDELDKHGIKTPIIAMSANMDDEKSEMYLKRPNVVATIPKPFFDIDLVELANEHINKGENDG